MSATVIDAHGNAHDTRGMFTHQVKSEVDPSDANLAAAAPACPLSADDVLTGDSREEFTEFEISELHDLRDTCDISELKRVEGRISLIRAKRIGDLAAAMWPEATMVVLEPDADGNPNLQVAAVQLADGSRVPADLDDPRFELLSTEAIDLYPADQGWQRTCAQAGPTWLLVIEEARSMNSADLDDGFYDPCRAGRAARLAGGTR